MSQQVPPATDRTLSTKCATVVCNRSEACECRRLRSRYLAKFGHFCDQHGVTGPIPGTERKITDAAGCPLRMFLSAGQRSVYIGARALLAELRDAKHMLADRGYDADWYREALEEKGTTPCIPSRKNRKVPLPHDADRYRKRHKIENSFARLKD